MSSEHVVETLEWDIAFASEHEAFEWQGRVASLLRGKAVDVIAQVFDELGGGHEVLALDRLELDLGRLPRAGFDEELAHRLRESLRDAVRHELGAAQGGALRTGTSLRPAATSRVQALEHYLLHGFLPWHVGSGTRRRLHQLAQRLAAEGPQEWLRWARQAPDAAQARLGALLRRHAGLARARLEAAMQSDGPLDDATRRAWVGALAWDGPWLAGRAMQLGQAARVRRHMARHFGDGPLLGLVELLVGQEQDFVHSVIAQAGPWGQSMDPPVPQEQMRIRLWEFTLAYLLVEQGSEFNRRSYLARVVAQSAQQGGVAYAELLQALLEVLAQGEGGSSLRRDMLGVLQALLQEHAPQADAHAAAAGEAASRRLIAASDAEPQDALAWLGRMKLRAEWTLRGDADLDTAARQAWERLLATEPQWLRALVQHWGREEAVRERMASRFGHAMLLDITGLVVPAEREFIASVVTNPAWLARAMDPPVPALQLQPRLWEFTLGYLLAQRGSEFNRRSYLAGLLRRSAAQHGMDYAHLLNVLMRTLAAPGAAPGLQRQMLALLSELHEALPQDVQAAPADGVQPGSQRWKVLALPQLRFAWRSGWAEGRPGTGEVLRAWRELAGHDAAWLAQELRRQLQTPAACGRAAEALAPEQLGEAADLLAPGAGAFAAELARQAAAWAGQGAPAGRLSHAGPAAARRSVWEFTLHYLASERGTEFNRRSYMESVLRQMARANGVGYAALLRLLVAGLQAAPAASVVHGQMLALATGLLSRSQERAQAGEQPQPAWDGLLGFLTGSEPCDPVQAQAWLAQAEAALRDSGRSPHAAALEEALQHAHIVERVVGLLPARLLTRMVFRLRRTEHHAVLAAADLLAKAWSVALPLPASRLQELKWRFIFQYLFVEGRPFDAATFARRMAEWLAAALHMPPQGEWRQSLAAEVALQRGSGGQVLGREMAAALAAPAVRTAARIPARVPRQEPAQAVPEALDEPIYVANAGMVLAEPFVPHLFSLCGLLEDNKFKDAVCAARGVHLLQALVMGPGEWDEHELVLNKLLCGLLPADALAWSGPLEPQALATVNSLLVAMLQQWKVLGATTPAGLQETFLRREGRLLRKEDHWQLLVEPGPFDMLVDQLPWGISMVKYPWMERMLHVQWR